MLRSLVLVVLAGARLAHADGVSSIAVAVNPPLRWGDPDAIAGSGYLGFGAHHALRITGAAYDYSGDIGKMLLGMAIVGPSNFESDAASSGRIVDAGVGWMYFPRRLWSGLSLEGGVLVRRRDTRTDDEFQIPERVERATSEIGGRALVGWSWCMFSRAFISLQLGLSFGHEWGTETTTDVVDLDDMPVTHDVSRLDVTAEGFLRIGTAFGL